MRRKLIRVVLALILLSQLLGSLSVVKGQSIPPEVSRYTQPGETAVEMVPVRLSGATYRVFYFTKDPAYRNVNGMFFYSRPRLPDAITSFLVIDPGLRPVTDEASLRQIFLIELGGYLLHNLPEPEVYYATNADLTSVGGLTDQIIKVAGFGDLILGSQISETNAERYAEVLSLMLADARPESAEVSGFIADVLNAGRAAGEVPDIGKTLLDLFDGTLQAAKYSNSASVRKHAAHWRALLEQLQSKITFDGSAPGQRYRFFDTPVSFLNLFDIIELSLSLARIEVISEERLVNLVALSQAATVSGLGMDADLQQAIQIVEAEHRNDNVRVLDIVSQFVRSKAVDLGSDILKETLATQWAKWSYKTYGTRIIGHRVAGAVSAVFVAFTIADLFYGREAVYENIVLNDYADRASQEYRRIGRGFHEQLLASPASYDSATAEAYRWAAIYANLAANQWFTAAANKISSARAITWLGNLVSGGEWTRIEQEIRQIGQDAEARTDEMLINPPPVLDAVSLAQDRGTQAPLPTLSGAVIGIQAGHGNGDPGALPCDKQSGVTEAQVNEAIARLAAAQLENLGASVTVFIGEDQALNGFQGQAFVALHAEYCPDPADPSKYSGFKVARRGGSASNLGLNGSQDASDLLTQALWTEYERTTGLPRDAGRITDNMLKYYALGQIDPSTPGAIIEMGWLSGDFDFLTTQQDVAATGIVRGLASFLSQSSLRAAPADGSSSTVLLFDTSGSMDEFDASGSTKIDAARKAGSNILDIIDAENQAQSTDPSQIAIAHFSYSASVDAPLSTDILASRQALQTLIADGGTGMSDGLAIASELLRADTTTAHKILILLSDGLPNIALGGNQNTDVTIVQQQVLDLAAEAGRDGQCIYVVGFGVPMGQGMVGSLDEAFLTQVADASGCGPGHYYNAQNATALADVYVRLRHATLGNVLYERTGNIAQDEELSLGTFEVPDQQAMMLYTLNWPGSQLDAVMVDPNGKTVDPQYPGASLTVADSIATVIIQNPQPGTWQIGAKGVDVPEGVTTFNAVVSSRAGTPKATPPTTAGSFPLVILTIILAGGGVAIWVMARSSRRQRLHHGAAVAASARLIGIQGEWAGRSIPLTGNRLMIGRARTNTIVLTESSVSRQHAALALAAGQWFIQDQGTSTGTWVNGRTVAASALRSGDRVRIGSSEFEFRMP